MEDKSIAVDFYEKAAKLGTPYAQYRLAQAYCEGIGVSKADVSTCYAWALKASEKPPEALKKPVQSLLLSIESLSSETEQEDGKRLYEELRVKPVQVDKKEDPADMNFSFF